MTNIKVHLAENSYDIVVGEKHLKDLGEALKRLSIGSDAMVVTQHVIKRQHGKTLAASLGQNGFTVKFFEVPDGEKSKSAQMAFQLIEKIATSGVKKKIFIIAFGGGVIGDLAGFVAAVYKRGIPLVQVPTTFLAQIDSAIGGKVAVDLPKGKNLVGSFYQPKLVWSDIALLSTLSPRQVRNGIAEAIKYGVILDRNLFDYIDRHYEKLLNLDPKVLSDVIATCSQLKAQIVMNDEKETKSARTILNFGHTVGHAIEAASQYRYQHGEAIALGMCIAANISCRMGLWGEIEASRIQNLCSKVGLPDRIQNVSLADILKHMQFDKKFQGAKNRFVLATGLGHVKVVEDVHLNTIKAAIHAYMA